LATLGEHARGRHEHRAAGHHGEGLRRGIAVVEVHLVRLELTAAIGARNAPEIAQQLDHARLADSNPLELQIPIPTVILDVVRSLVALGSHGKY
jgi:hypothetical protein